MKTLSAVPVKLPVRPSQQSADTQLRKTCQEFEAILMQGMLKSMRATIPDGGLFEKSNDKDIFQELMDTEVSRSMAQGQGAGIAQSLYRQFQPQTKE